MPNPIAQPPCLRIEEGPDDDLDFDDGGPEEEIDVEDGADDGGPDDVEDGPGDFDDSPDDVEDSPDDMAEDDDGDPGDVEDAPDDVEVDDDGGPDEETASTPLRMLIPDGLPVDSGLVVEEAALGKTMLALTKASAIAVDQPYIGKAPCAARLAVFVPMDGPVHDLAQLVNRGLQTSNAAKTTKTMRVFSIFTDPDLDGAARHARALQVFKDTKNPKASLSSCLSHLKAKGLEF